MAVENDVDTVLVVRCKDCKSCFKYNTKRYKQTIYKCLYGDGCVQVRADDFCSRGKRRINDGKV